MPIASSFSRRCGSSLLLLALGTGCAGRAHEVPAEASTPADDGGPLSPDGDFGEDAPAGDADLLEGAVSCAMDPRIDTYTAGLTKAGAKGAAQVKIVSADPAPPAKGGNTWSIQILDASGNPLDATVTVDEKMPDHGHGTAVKPKITPGDGAGTYTIAPLYLFMAGVWRVQLSILPAGADGGPPIDVVSFYFCIEG
jgi:hypothetical protein